MAERKRKGELAELMVAADLVRQGHRVAFPHGEDWAADLIVDRDGALERVQVKHATGRNGVIVVKCRTHSMTNGRVVAITRYTSEHIEWLAAWDSASGDCFYVPAAELGEGMSEIHLRTAPARNGQVAGTRPAADYRYLGDPPRGRGANGNTRPLQG